MRPPDLPPDIRFHFLPKDEQALRYSFEAERAAMGPCIVQRWGWDEALQMRLHGERFGEKPFFKVVRRDHTIGTVSVMQLADHVRFGEFYLFPEFQRRPAHRGRLTDPDRRRCRRPVTLRHGARSWICSGVLERDLRRP